MNQSTAHKLLPTSVISALACADEDKKSATKKTSALLASFQELNNWLTAAPRLSCHQITLPSKVPACTLPVTHSALDKRISTSQSTNATQKLAGTFHADLLKLQLIPSASGLPVTLQLANKLEPSATFAPVLIRSKRSLAICHEAGVHTENACLTTLTLRDTGTTTKCSHALATENRFFHQSAPARLLRSNTSLAASSSSLILLIISTLRLASTMSPTTTTVHETDK